MPADKQHLYINTYDHRHDPPKVNRERFTNHRDYLNRMKELTSEPGTVVSEQTGTRLDVYDKRAGTPDSLFD